MFHCTCIYLYEQDMNEPASFVHGSISGCTSDNNPYDYPPFLPREYVI